ncbi:MAG TPA: amidase [Vicinamibacterales bacterium]|nr:amidase [Vicinamibacterales bacterium]
MTRLPLSRRDVLAQLAALTASVFSFGGRPEGLRYGAPGSDPLDGTIADYVAGLRGGRWTAAEVTARAIERCRREGAAWRAIDALSTTALADAKAADQRARARNMRGPLDGVPVFAKAIYDMKGLPTTASNAEWARLFPDPINRDAVEVARMRAAGAIVLGKTAADDFAYRGAGTSSHTGQVRNPYDPTGTRTPGGSSAGSAVAVAGSMAFAAVGTDDGGSNRIPAVCVGIVGMKPTFGLVPRTGVVPTWPYLDTHGPLARSVADAALLLAVIAGADPSDPLSHGRSTQDGRRYPLLRDDALNGVRLGVVDAHVPRDKMTREAVDVWDRTLADLRAAGAIVEPFLPPVTLANYRNAFADAEKGRGGVKGDARSPAATANALYRYFAGRTGDPIEAVRRGYDAYRSFYDVLPKRFEDCVSLLQKPLEHDAAGQSFARSRRDVVAALGRSMKAAGVAAMIYPTMPFNAFRLADGWPDVRTALGYGNWLGLPEVSVPSGLGGDGLPALSLSVVSLPGQDASALAFAHAYERQSRRFVPSPRA